MWPACGCSFFSFPWAGKEIELSHMGKNNGNPDLACEKIDYSKDCKNSIRGPSFIRIITFHGDGGWAFIRGYRCEKSHKNIL